MLTRDKKLDQVLVT